MNEHAIVAVNLRRAQRFAIHRDNSLADLAGALRDQLFQPRAQIVNSRRRNDGDFVAAKIAQRSQNCAQDRAGILVRRNFRLAGLHHFLGALKKFAEIQPHDGGRDHAKVGKGRVASANAGNAEKDFAEVIALGHLLHLGAGIGDGDEVLAGFILADSLLHAIEEILLEDIWFQRAAGLAGDDAQRFCQINLVFNGLDLRRIG